MSYRKVARRLADFGFLPVCQQGSHVKFKHADGRFTIVPHHAREEIRKGLVLDIIKAGSHRP